MFRIKVLIWKRKDSVLRTEYFVIILPSAFPRHTVRKRINRQKVRLEGKLPSTTSPDSHFSSIHFASLIWFFQMKPTEKVNAWMINFDFYKTEKSKFHTQQERSLMFERWFSAVELRLNKNENLKFRPIFGLSDMARGTVYFIIYF